MENKQHFLSEKEINGDNILSQDYFKYNVYAEKIKKLIQSNSNNNEPITIGIYGKWGEGKTSFSNLIKHNIEHFEDKGKKEYFVYDFNPWRYSTEDEILFDFFDGLKKAFYVKDKNKFQLAGEYLLSYSKYLKAVKISATVGLPKILNSKIEFSPDKIFEALGEDLKEKDITIETLRKKVNEEISKINFKILIFIDDIDRLDDSEIYTLFKLVKLNANFDNFIFILNFDEEQVAKALKNKSGENFDDGKKYLEKIINIPIHLPKIEEYLLEKYFREQLAKVLKNLSLSYERQQDINSRIEFHNYDFKNPRQIKRVLNSFFIGAFSLNDEVNLIDLFSLEYIKLTNTKLYNQLKKISPSKDKNSISKVFDDEKGNGFNERINDILKSESSKLLNILFDAKKANTSLSIRNSDCFDRYFSYHIGNKTPNYLINNIIKSIDNENLNDGKLEEIFQFEDSYFRILELAYSLKNNKLKRDNFFELIIRNLHKLNSLDIDFYGLDDKNRLVERIASYLDENDTEDNNEISMRLAKKLDIHQLCFFIRKFKEKQQLKKDLINILVNKSEKEFSISKPVFIEPSMTAKMIMIYWSEQKPETFNQHINSTLIDLLRIKKLIRNFPVFILGKLTFGGLVESNFEYMSKIVDIRFVFKKIKEFDKSLIDNSNELSEIDDTGQYSEDDNLIQFIYWYKKLGTGH